MSERKPIPGFEGFFATSDGKIFCGEDEKRQYFTEGGGKARYPKAKRIKYAAVCIGGRNRAVHRLVCAAFYGPAPKDKPIVRHLDGNPLNNHYANLCWGTASENTQDSILHGTNTGRIAAIQGALTQMLKSRGVYFSPERSKTNPWYASIHADRKQIGLGQFKTEEEALAARSGAIRMYAAYKRRGHELP